MSLPALREALQAHGGTVATLVNAPANAPAPADFDGADGADGAAAEPADSPPRLAARGPRAIAHAAEYELLLEMILEGSLLHYGAPRVVGVEDPDLALLVGDQLYALGLSRLADLGDLEAVAELADLISLLAQARAASDARLADAIWEAGATAIGWGRTPQHEAAKALARRGDRAAVAALLECARRDSGIPQ